MAEIGAYKTLKFRDYQAGTITDAVTKEAAPTNLPSSNVLYYELEDEAWVCVRPSGTEPKIKFYMGVKGTSLKDSMEKSKKLGQEVLKIVDELI